MISQKNLLLAVLLVTGVLLLQPVFAAETYTTNFYPIPTTARINFISGTASPESGVAPLTVQFNDTSRYPLGSWDWDFGDGSTHSYIKNPVHVYTTPGSFQVTLKQKNAYVTPTKIVVITVTSPAPIDIPNITATIICPIVFFNGTSAGDPTSWLWNFGDGTTSSEQNPVHRYSVNGEYTVNLTATNVSGFSSASKQIFLDCVIPVSDVTITTWTKDGEYTVAGAEVYLDRKGGRLLGKTGIDGSVTVSVPYDTAYIYAKSPVYKDSYFYEGSWITSNLLDPANPSPIPSPISIRLDQKVSDLHIFTEADNNATVSMEKGSTILLKLGENAGSTGYRWELSTTPGLKVTGNSFVSSGTCDGCGGIRIWEMIADSTGQQQIVAVSKRSWEPTTGQERTFRMTINVD